MGLSALLLLLAAPQDAKKSDAELDQARRAAIVDRIMAEPPKPRLARPVPVQLFDANIAVVPERRLLRLEPREPSPAGGEAVANVPILPGFRPMNGREMALASANFDLWLFDDDADEATRRVRLDALLTERIRKAWTNRRLDLEQVRKLRLAGAGDIKRLLDRVAAKRVEFESVRADYNAGREILGQLEIEAQQFRIGPFHGESLFAKTLRKIDDEDRKARFGPK